MILYEVTPNFNKDEWQRYFEFGAHYYYRHHLRYWTRDINEYIEKGLKLLARPGWRECWIMRDDSIIGTLRSEPRVAMKGEMFLSVYGTTLETLNDDEIAIIRHWLTDLKESTGLTKCRIMAQTVFERKFAMAIQNELIDEDRFVELEMQNVNGELMQQWIQNAQTENLREELFERVPETLWDSYIDLINQGFEGIPFNDPGFVMKSDADGDRRRLNDPAQDEEKYLVFMLLNADNQPVALTEVAMPKGKQTASQMMTAVHPAFKGRGLAKFVKARMWQTLNGRYKDIKSIKTWTAATNIPMIKINDEMGFKYTDSMYFYKVIL